MKKTKIDWCDCTINPVVGCQRGCKYCYARIINNRFNKKYPKRFAKNFAEPEFKPERLNALKSKKPRSIFMDSMSDTAFWKEKWLWEVSKAVLDNRHHSYIFLTKGTERNISIVDESGRQVVFWGKTITKQEDTHCDLSKFDFLSCEPLLEDIIFTDMTNIKQVIIGAETGNRKDKVVPGTRWVRSIVSQCDARGIRVFMKENLREIMGDAFRQDELIWAVAK